MQTVYFLGKLSATNRKEASEIVRQAGGKVAQRIGKNVDIIVVGDANILKPDWNLWNDQLDEYTREAFEQGRLAIISETQFWEQYTGQTTELTKMLYTPAMLVKLSGLPISILRRLHLEGLIVPVQEIFRLVYFDNSVILPLKIMQNMLAAGLPRSVAIKHLSKVERHNPATLSEVRVEGKDIIFTSEKGSVDQNGQRFFSFADDYELTIQ